jgi:DNA end-binding protein Ku
MPARAYWKGYLRLSLVTIGVELFSAVSGAERLALHQIHAPSGKRIRYQKVAPGVGPVSADEIVKGYEIDKDRYVVLEDEELDAIKLESRRAIDLVQFVDFGEIDPRYYEKSYYVVPIDDEVAAEGFTVIRDALNKVKKVGLGQMAVRGRDYIVAIRPLDRGLVLETLRYADEIRESSRIFDAVPDIKADREMLELATELIERKAAPFDPDAFHSQYAKALRALIKEKQTTGEVAEVSEEELARPAGNVIDLMEALKRSVGREKKGGVAERRPPAKRPAKKSPPRRRGGERPHASR